MSSRPESPQSTQALLGMGSNLSERRKNLEHGIKALAATNGITVVARSFIYESEPIGYRDQPHFLNLVLAIETTLTPEALLDATLEIEASLGRVRTFPNAPRTLDIDILFHGDKTLRTTRLTLPHPRYAERPFVVVPLEEVLGHPALRHPLWDNLRAELKKTNSARGGLRRWDDSVE